MSIRLILLSFTLLYFIKCSSQQENAIDTSCNSQKTLFLNGICIKNIGVMIPWYFNYSELEKYQYSKIDTSAKNGAMEIFWDSASILNDVKARVYIHNNKKVLRKNRLIKLGEIVCIIDRSYLQKIIETFEEYNSCKDCYLKTKTFYSWKIDGCVVRLNWKINHKVDFLNIKNAFYLLIQKI